VALFAAYTVKEVLISLAAGPAAVAMGAHANGSPLTGHMLKIGLIASVTKAGMDAFVGIISFGTMNSATTLLIGLLFTTTGMSVLIAAEISSMVLGEGS
jgi:hypothetical protein